MTHSKGPSLAIEQTLHADRRVNARGFLVCRYSEALTTFFRTSFEVGIKTEIFKIISSASQNWTNPTESNIENKDFYSEIRVIKINSYEKKVDLTLSHYEIKGLNRCQYHINSYLLNFHVQIANF